LRNSENGKKSKEKKTRIEKEVRIEEIRKKIDALSEQCL